MMTKIDTEKQKLIKKPMALFSHPTQVIWIDDDIAFVEKRAAEIMIEEDALYFNLFDNPEQALAYISDQAAKDPYYDDTYVPSIASSSSDDGVETDLNDTMSYYFSNRDRHNHIAVILVDQDMPVMSGDVFCRKLDELNLPVKIIMITGKEKADFGINLLSEDYVDVFIEKKDLELTPKIIKAIHSLHYKHFYGLSSVHFQAITADPQSPLDNKAFQAFFNHICQQHAIVEYEFINTEGDAILQTRSGELRLLGVACDAALDELNDLFDSYEVDSSNDLVLALRQREKIPLFLTAEDEQKPIEAWSAYFHPAKAIDNLPGFYYTLVDDLSAYQLDEDKVFSYEDYLRSRQS
ncbi:MAG: hypothetical protein AAGA27_03425 [Pseudomonadota bacterium]